MLVKMDNKYDLNVYSNQEFEAGITFDYSFRLGNSYNLEYKSLKYPKKVENSEYFMTLTLTLISLQDKPAVLHNLKNLLKFIMIFPKINKIKHLGLEVGISHDDLKVVVEISMTDKFLEAYCGDTGKKKLDMIDIRDYGEKVDITLKWGLCPQNLFTKDYYEIIEKAFDFSFYSTGDEHIKHILSYIYKRMAEDPILINKDKKILKVKIIDKVLDYIETYLFDDDKKNKLINIDYCYDRKYVRDNFYEYGSFNHNFTKEIENLKQFQETVKTFLNVTKLVEHFTGLFGKVLKVIKYFDLDHLEFNIYSKMKMFSSCNRVSIPGISDYLKKILCL